jgi:hypothetical protein
MSHPVLFALIILVGAVIRAVKLPMYVRDVWDVEVELHVFLTISLVGDELSASRINSP